MHGNKYTISSVQKAAKILKCFTFNKPDLGVTEISQGLGLHKATVHKILKTLEQEGLVEKNEQLKKYRLGARIFQLGSIVHDQLDLTKCALSVMKKLSREVEETVALYILMGQKRVCIEKIEANHLVKRHVRIGEALPLYCGSSSKLLLAFNPDREKILPSLKLRRHAPNTITDLDKLKLCLQEVREKGYSVSFEERVKDSAGVSAPIRDSLGDVVAALTILGPIIRLTPEKITSYIPLLVEAANEISSRFGYYGE